MVTTQSSVCDPFVFAEVAFLTQSCASLSLLLPGPEQIWGALVGCPADTLVIARVYVSNVFPQSYGLNESAPAMLAFVRLFARVRVHMVPQSGGPCKPLTTNLAFVRLFARVHELMSL